jgi:hypothetical protein
MPALLKASFKSLALIQYQCGERELPSVIPFGGTLLKKSSLHPHGLYFFAINQLKSKLFLLSVKKIPGYAG